MSSNRVCYLLRYNRIITDKEKIKQKPPTGAEHKCSRPSSTVCRRIIINNTVLPPPPTLKGGLLQISVVFSGTFSRMFLSIANPTRTYLPSIHLEHVLFGFSCSPTSGGTNKERVLVLNVRYFPCLCIESC